MPHPMKIDFVSDVACPWCVIGLLGLEKALEELGDEIDAQIHFQPFELSPDLGSEGRNVVEHLSKAYGSTPDQTMERRQAVSDRAAQLNFDMLVDEDARLFNTFDAHRLIHWAGLQGRQAEIKHALFEAYHGRNDNVSDASVLIAAAQAAGLNPQDAQTVIESGQYAQEVRGAEYLWQSRGVTGVPAAIINERYILSGAQTPEAYAQALRQIAGAVGGHMTA
jgi:predicted DsbA family dithiol-disulfide isomerase